MVEDQRADDGIDAPIPRLRRCARCSRAEIGRALDELPEDYRTAVVLSDVEELSYKEIADIMGCPIGTVMSRLASRSALAQGPSLRARASDGYRRTRSRGSATKPEPVVELDQYRDRARKAVHS